MVFHALMVGHVKTQAVLMDSYVDVPRDLKVPYVKQVIITYRLILIHAATELA